MNIFTKIKFFLFKPRIWVIADTHFFHKNIIKYDGLPFNNVEEMNKCIIKKWNRKIRDNDIVIHLGDFGFGNKEKIKEIVKQLKGKKILILGNHDKHSKSFYRSIFDEVYNGYYRLVYNGKVIHFIHNPADIIKHHLQKEENYIIYGHIHKAILYDFPIQNTFCACMVKNNYAPIKLKNIIKEWERMQSYDYEYL